MSNPENAPQDSPGARGTGSCECQSWHALDELYRLLQHLEDAPQPKYVLTHSHNQRIRAALATPCPCDDLRAQLDTIKGPGYAQRLQDLEERAAENRQLRAELAEALDLLGALWRDVPAEQIRSRAADILAKREATGGER